MLTTSALRKWYWVHKWTSLICTLFLLLLCITGLPLIFRHELDHALGNSVELPEQVTSPGQLAGSAPALAGSAPAPAVDLDSILATARAEKPGHAVQFVSRDPDEPDAWLVSLGETVDAPESSAFYTFDARTGALVNDYPLDE